MSAFYILVPLVIAYLLWRGRRERSRRMLSPAELGEVLERSRSRLPDASAAAPSGEGDGESLRRPSGD